jgi:hypothetical protein
MAVKTIKNNINNNYYYTNNNPQPFTKICTQNILFHLRYESVIQKLIFHLISIYRSENIINLKNKLKKVDGQEKHKALTLISFLPFWRASTLADSIKSDRNNSAAFVAITTES